MRTRDEMAALNDGPSGQGGLAAGDGQHTTENRCGNAIPNELSASNALSQDQSGGADSGGASPAPIRRKAVRRAGRTVKSDAVLPGDDVSADHIGGETRALIVSSGSGQYVYGTLMTGAAPDQFAGLHIGVAHLSNASMGVDQAGVVTQTSCVHPQTFRPGIFTPAMIASMDGVTIAAIQSLHREHRAIQRAVGDMDRRIKAEARWFAVRRYRAEGIPLPTGKFPDVTKADEQMVVTTRARFFAIRASIEAERKACQKELLALVKPLPIMAWAKDVKGLGIASVAAIIGEAGDLANYANPGKLWKRMGLAVIDGKSQGKRTNAEEALRHGYSPQRRSEMHVVGDCMVRAGGPYADLYRARKAVEMEREGITKMHAHKRALRYIEKRLLREMWQVWRGANAAMQTESQLPPAEELAGHMLNDTQDAVASQDGGPNNSDAPTIVAPVQLSRAKRVRRAEGGLLPKASMPGAELVAAE